MTPDISSRVVARTCAGRGRGPTSASESESESTAWVGRALGNAGPITRLDGGGGDGERRVEGPGVGPNDGAAVLRAAASSGGSAGV